MNDRLLQACRGEQTNGTPVWFMRQAGRYMQAYQTIRKRYGLMEMFKNPELAAEITLQPIRAFAVDAAIIFADILLPLEGMGIGFDFLEKRGPVMHHVVRTPADVHALRVADPDESLDFVLASLRHVRAELDGRLPLIGFVGAPFTLAGYMIEGGTSAHHQRTKQFMYHEPDSWQRLMEKLTTTLIAFLRAQIQAGAQLVQLFDSWVGCLSPADYSRYVLPYTQKIFAALKADNIPSIHFGTATAGLLPLMAAAGGDVIGADWRISLPAAWASVSASQAVGIKGNLDPMVLLTAPREVIKREAAAILHEADTLRRETAHHPTHIFNLGHGILPETSEDEVKALADFIHNYNCS